MTRSDISSFGHLNVGRYRLSKNTVVVCPMDIMARNCQILYALNTHCATELSSRISDLRGFGCVWDAGAGGSNPLTPTNFSIENKAFFVILGR
jgi:hypothetical protein